MSTRRIIIADDEPYVISILGAKLQDAGYNVVIAHDGEEVLALAATHTPDLIVSDFQMPTMSGYEMAVQLKHNPATAGIPVIMLTARGHLLSPSQLAATNIQHLLSKPFSAKELLARVDDVIGPAVLSRR